MLVALAVAGCSFAPKFESLAPEPRDPRSGATFDHFPRTTRLSWDPVPGATSYTVQVDCFHCCEIGKWCSEVGKPKIEAAGLRGTTYSFVWVGANLGRWRVWAVAPDGVASKASPWEDFEYTR
jgi:hypothetical protein